LSSPVSHIDSSTKSKFLSDALPLQARGWGLVVVVVVVVRKKERVRLVK
jgi:hypothetical protein